MAALEVGHVRQAVGAAGRDARSTASACPAFSKNAVDPAAPRPPRSVGAAQGQKTRRRSWAATRGDGQAPEPGADAQLRQAFVFTQTVR